LKGVRLTCPKCGAQIVYVKNARGQKMAVNAETWRDGEEDFVYEKHRLHLPWCHGKHQNRKGAEK
jgi:hypothetical protein